MGLFDTMLGNKAKDVDAATQQRFTTLKQKYASALTLMEQKHVQLQNLHVENDKLFVRGMASSDEVKNAVWNEVKRVDPAYPDLTLDLTINASLAPAAGAKPAGGEQFERYTVKAGDTLSKIAQQFYGDKMAYPRIFEANKDILKDPNKIDVGQQLKIPKMAMA